MFTKNFILKSGSQISRVGKEYAGLVMEKCVGADYIQFKNDKKKVSNSSEISFSSCINLSTLSKQESDSKNSNKISRLKKKVVLQKQYQDQSDLSTVILEKIGSEPETNVLKQNSSKATRKSVHRKTKIVKKNVPDRLGKNVTVSYNVRSDTKLNFFGSKIKKNVSENECTSDKNFQFLEEHSKMKLLLDECSETKLDMLGNECLNNNEAVRLDDSFESDSNIKNIFESFIDDCLNSTSKEKALSSHENNHLREKNKSIKLNSDLKKRCEKSKRKRMSKERNENKEKQEKSLLAISVKIKDHNNYYRSHKSIRHVCTYCQKIFKSNGKLNSHIFSHTGERPFDCSHCGKAFSSKFKLVRHLLIHSEVRKFVCQICDRTFVRNDHLKNHYKVHDPQKKLYKCPKQNCKKEYSSIMSYKKHMAYHNIEDGDLKCLICSVKHETKDEILLHLKTHSGSRLLKSQSDKKFKCDFCERLFLTRKDVNRHLVVHTGERDFLCQFCPQRFGRKDHLVRHIKKSHENEELSPKKETNVKTSNGPNKHANEKQRKNGESITGNNQIKSKSNLARLNQPYSLPLLNDPVPERDNDEKKGNSKSQTDSTVAFEESPNKFSDSLNQRHNMSTEKGSKKEVDHENYSPTSGKKQKVCFAKSKSEATQIFLPNLPNILIVPSNSIILVRNQNSKDWEAKGTSAAAAPSIAVTSPKKPELPLPEEFLDQPATSSDNFTLDFHYDPSSLLPASQFLGGFSDGDNFYQNDLIPYGFPIEDSGQEPETLKPEEKLPDGQSRMEFLPSGYFLTETSRQLKLRAGSDQASETTSKQGKGKAFADDLEKNLFGSDMLHESFLKDLKVEPTEILPADHEAIFQTLANQVSDTCGAELLRNLLTNESPALSPLPGFSQIFHNSNANFS